MTVSHEKIKQSCQEMGLLMHSICENIGICKSFLNDFGCVWNIESYELCCTITDIINHE